ncbi:hypothetical protein [Fusibacillus kribbianus]|uniref:Uncharacterized protein n=1 Tax=Fusibacillus kribbianus TaxID=3044208 RepID=A0AAP4EYY5_9FIRM|nr:hypothetical protein [Ruminococcus sp. YH-rum2234]MDI9243477.1 hypothetical protein [Ruminococcus sp. YH-rum2234]
MQDIIITDIPEDVLTRDTTIRAEAHVLSFMKETPKRHMDR